MRGEGCRGHHSYKKIQTTPLTPHCLDRNVKGAKYTAINRLAAKLPSPFPRVLIYFLPLSILIINFSQSVSLVVINVLIFSTQGRNGSDG